MLALQAAFVTGGLDPVLQREDWLQQFRASSVPVLVVIGEQSPPHSRSELEALAALPGVQIERLPGSLGLHEEYASDVAALVLSFLR